jgi:hypothetical protein
MEVQATLELYQALPLDGGNCSDMKVASLSMIKERLWMFKVESMLKTETSLFIKSMVKSTRDGRSSMLMSTLMNQQRVNSTRNSDSMLKEISTSFLNFHPTDTST